MELRRYLTVLRSRRWLIFVTTALAALVAYGVTASPDRYVARSTIYVGSTAIAFDPGAGEISNDRMAGLDRLVLTFSRMIDSEPVAERAIDELDVDLTPDEVVAATTTTPELATQLLYIDVVDADPALAQSLSTALADAFVEAVQEFEPVDSEGSIPRLPAYVFERASLPEHPVPSGQVRSVILAALFGLVVGAGVAFLLDYLDVSIRTAADAERYLELPVLGVIPEVGDHVPSDARDAAPPAQPIRGR